MQHHRHLSLSLLLVSELASNITRNKTGSVTACWHTLSTHYRYGPRPENTSPAGFIYSRALPLSWTTGSGNLIRYCEMGEGSWEQWGHDFREYYSPDHIESASILNPVTSVTTMTHHFIQYILNNFCYYRISEEHW